MQRPENSFPAAFEDETVFDESFDRARNELFSSFFKVSSRVFWQLPMLGE